VIRRNPSVRKQQSRTTRYAILLRIIQAANDKLDPRNVISTIMDNIQKLIPCEAWSILLLSKKQDELVFERARGTGAVRLAYKRLKMGEGIAGWVAQQRKPVIVNDVSVDPRFSSKFDRAIKFQTKSVLCVPLVSRNRVIGVVELINKKSKSRHFTKQDLNTLLLLLGPMAVSLDNALLFQETEKLVNTDDLTKLYNTRYINQSIHKMIESHRTASKSFGVIFLDLDGFKAVNDQFGHLVGARTLIEVGKVIFNNVGKKDIVARYGGDEFLVIVPQAGAVEVLKMAEKIRSAICSYDFQSVLPEPMRLSASFGVSVFPDHADNLTELIQKADRAMYQVKYNEKNAVELAK